MEESSLTEEEKSMYVLCSSVLAACFMALVLINPSGYFDLTGAAVYGQNTKQNITINYENFSASNITQEIALNAILQAESDMQEMAEQGFSARWVNDTLIEAKKYFQGENYAALLEEFEKINDTEKRERAKSLLLAAQSKIGVEVDYKKVLENTKAIYERKKRAFEISDSIRASQLRAEEFKQQNLDASEVEGIISSSISEFKNERYENAEALLASIDKKLTDLSGETALVNTIYRAGKENMLNFVKERYKAILLLLGLMLVISMLLYNRIMIAILRGRIKDMKVEKDVIVELMKKAQQDYYAKGFITKQTFEIKMLNYKEKLVEIKQKLPVAESLVEKRLKSKRVL